MKILVVGAGVIGTIYGYVLAEAGNTVTHYVRPGKRMDLRGGIRLHLLDGRMKRPRALTHLYRLNVTETLSPEECYDLCIVSVRHYQLNGLLPLLKEGAGEADILIFNGNWEGFQVVDRCLGPSRYIWGFPVAGGGFAGGGLFGALLNEIHLGEPDGTSGPRLERIRTMFQDARIAVDVQPNMLHWLWVHFAINSGIIGAAFKAGGARELLKSVLSLRAGILAARDALAVCRARGVDTGAFDDARLFGLPPLIGAMAVWGMMKTNQPARRIFETHNAIDELQSMYRDVLRTGMELNIPMRDYLTLRRYVEDPHVSFDSLPEQGYIEK